MLTQRRVSPNFAASEVLDEDMPLDAEQLTALIRGRFASPSYRPPQLPGPALELLDLSSKPNVSLEVLSQFLAKDPMVAASVLRRAQSAIYGGATPPRTLKEALSRLGLNEMRNIVLEEALNLRVFRVEGFTDEMERLRRHSVATARMTRLICRYTSLDAEFGFLCGLMHDVGVAATLLAFADRSKMQREELLWEVVGSVHEDAGRLLAELWKLPPEIALILGSHHRVRIGGGSHPMTAALVLGEALAEFGGAGVTEDGVGGLASGLAFDRNEERVVSSSLHVLGFDDKRWELAKNDAKKVLAGKG